MKYLTIACGVLAACFSLAFENGNLIFNIDDGDSDNWNAESGFGTLTKSGAGSLTLTDALLFGGKVILQDGTIELAASDTTPLSRPDAALANAAFHVDASVPGSLVSSADGVTRWSDLRGGSYSYATPPNRLPLLLDNAVNGLPAVDFGRLAYRTGEERGMQWSQRLNATIKAAFWVVGSSHGHGFLLGDETAYHFHPDGTGMDAYRAYATPSMSVFSGHLPTLFREGAQRDGQALEYNKVGLSGAWDLVSVVASETATSGSTADRFANDRNLAPQGGAQMLAECIVFESLPSQAQRDQITAYLIDKWFRGPDLRVLELDGSGTLLGAANAAPRVHLLTGTGTLNVDGPARLDTIELVADGLTLDGTLPEYSIGLLRGTGTLTSDYELDLQAISLINNSAITLAAPVADDFIAELSGYGTVTLPGGVALGEVALYEKITVNNDGSPLAIATLTGHATLDTSNCGALSVAHLMATTNAKNANDYYRTIINAGDNNVYIDTLTGNGRVIFEKTTGLVTINDASEFTGEIYLEDGISAKILIPPDQRFRQLTVVNATLDYPADTLSVGRLYGRGTFVLNSDLSVSTIDTTSPMDITIGGTGLLEFDLFTGFGNLTVNRPFTATHYNLVGGTLNLDHTAIDKVSGYGTLNLTGTNPVITNANPNGTFTINNSATSLTISNLVPATTNVTLNVNIDGLLTLGTVNVPENYEMTLSKVAGVIKVDEFTGTGIFRKNGTADFQVAVPAPLAGLVVDGGALIPTRISTPTLPNSVVPALWLDASLADSIVTNSSGTVSEWHDVRADSLTDAPHVYSTSDANAPFVIPATANGLPVISTGEYESGRFLRWSESINVRAFFMACGSHEGMGYFIGNSSKNNWNRNYTYLDLAIPGIAGRTYLHALWNIGRGDDGTAVHLRDGRSYVNGHLFKHDIGIPFSGGYDVMSFINDVTDVDIDANQFSRYMSENSSFSGGARFGEVLICTNVVSEVDRVAVERYLQAKWIGDLRRLELNGETTIALGASETLSIGTACGSGSLTQSGNGTLKVSNAALLNGGLDIRAGTLAFAHTDAKVSYGPTFWVDAASYVTTNQYGYVTNWADTRNNGYYAWATNSADMEPPALFTAAGPQGKPVIDFNHYGHWGNATTFRKQSTPHYTWLAFNQEVNVGSGFWMLGSQCGGGFLLSHPTRYDFHRGNATLGNSPQPALFSTYNSAGNGVQTPAINGTLYADGTRIHANQTGVLNGDYQLVQLVTDGNLMPAARFSRDRTSDTQVGGQRLGEVILFERALTEKERRNTEAALSSKWFGDIRKLRLAPGTTFDTGSSTSAVSVAHLAGSGRVTHSGSAVLRLTEPSTFTGTLATRLDTIDVALKTPPSTPAAGASLWLDPSANPDAPLTDYSGNNITLTRLGGGPDLRHNELNGLPVLDFGPCVSSGKALEFTKGSVPVHSWIAVHGSQEGGGNLLGDNGDYPFYREASNEGGTKNPYARLWYDGGGTFAGTPLLRGWNMLDGVSLNSRSQGFTGGYSIYTTIPLEHAPWTNVRYIAADRSNPRGGMRLGEMLIFPRRISDADRVQTEAYLNSKWFARPSFGYAALKTPMLPHIDSLGGKLHIPEGYTAVLGRITGSPTEVQGGGGLVLTSGGSTQPASVASGELRLTTTASASGTLNVTDGLVFHVDASDANSLTINTESKVTKWADTRGNDYPYAYADGSTHLNTEAGANAIPEGIALNPPTLAPAALNGKPAVDFGPGTTTSTVWMRWNQSLSPLRSGFFVVRTPFPNNAGGSLLSPAYGDINHFARRIKSTSYETPRPLFYFEDFATRVDGNPINPAKAGLDDDWHLVSFTVSSLTSSAQAFAADRPGRVVDSQVSPNSLRCGGVLYAEVLLYNRVLSADEIAAVEAYLKAKWFSDAPLAITFDGQNHTSTTVELGSDGTLVLDGVNSSLVSTTGTGTVMDSAVPPTVWQLNGPRKFTQGLILADGATVHVDYNGNATAADRIDVTGGLTVKGSGTIRFASIENWKPGASLFPLFSYDTLTGGSNWTTLWRGANAPNGVSLKGVVDSSLNTLNANIIPSGTILLLK